MSAPSLRLTTQKETVSTGFKITFTASQSVGMTDKIFVIKRSTNLYDRVASRYDLTYVSDTPSDGETYYRAASFSSSFEFEQEAYANTFASEIPPMVDRLVVSLSDPTFDETIITDHPIG